MTQPLDDLPYNPRRAKVTTTEVDDPDYELVAGGAFYSSDRVHIDGAAPLDIVREIEAYCDRQNGAGSNSLAPADERQAKSLFEICWPFDAEMMAYTLENGYPIAFEGLVTPAIARYIQARCDVHNATLAQATLKQAA